ncbi:MAG: hypothetical protein M1839_005921 [Geoglossum umbratile]|nr:MAG: hypothetical protein M1839_005921 [Geoglossum umbratile]
MHYRMRSLDAAFKQRVARPNLTTAAELKPWVRVRDDISSKIQEPGKRAARHAMEVEEAQSKQEIGTQEAQGKADEGLGDNAGSEPLPSEQCAAIHFVTGGPASVPSGCTNSTDISASYNAASSPSSSSSQPTTATPVNAAGVAVVLWVEVELATPVDEASGEVDDEVSDGVSDEVADEASDEASDEAVGEVADKVVGSPRG